MRVEIDNRRRKGENCRRKRHLLKRWSDTKTSPPIQRLMRSRDRLLLSPHTLLGRKISTRCFTIMLFTEQWKNPKQRSPYCHIRYSMLFEIYRIWLLCFYQKGVFIMTKQSHYNVGIYVRLSQEDERAGESISIENQKKC